MTTLITIAIVLLFGLCVYIESNYRHTVHKTARETGEPTKSSKYYHWGEDITVGFLLTISKWLFVSILFSMLMGIIRGFKDIEPILYDDYKTLWWILAAAIAIGSLWYFYLGTLIKRSKQINFGNQNIKLPQNLGFKFAPKSSLIFTLWILFLIIVPYLTMDTMHSFLFPYSNQITPTQYQGNDTILSQILQEVANNNAEIRTEIRSSANQLYKILLTGITSSTVVLGLLIFYRTRKLEKDE